jgi:hypothetical protein
MENKIYYFSIIIACVVIFLNPISLFILSLLEKYFQSVFNFLTKNHFIQMGKIVFGVIVILFIGYIAGHYCLSGELVNDLNGFRNLKYYANLFLIVFGLFPAILLFLAFTLSIVVSGCNEIAAKFGSNEFPKPDGCVRVILYLLLSFYFTIMLICAIFTNQRYNP